MVSVGSAMSRLKNLKQEIDCLRIGDETTPIKGEIIPVKSSQLEHVLSKEAPQMHSFVRARHYTARHGEICLLPARDGKILALWGMPQLPSNVQWGPYYFADLPRKLPGGVWSIRKPQDFERRDVLIGFCLGSQKFSLKTTQKDTSSPQLLVGQQEIEKEKSSLDLVRYILFARALITMPANQLGPQELANTAKTWLEEHNGLVQLYHGQALKKEYPLVEMVGRGAERQPAVVFGKWSGSKAKKDAPLFSIVGKGVCFDTGGLDLKGTSSMLKMKKDMGGAASALSLALLIMAADLPVRLEIRLGCVENAISGKAMRPLDVVKSRSGLTVEIGNTDAEGRLVLADLLSAAAQNKPTLLIDMATLTGSARSALGPDIPAFFSNDAAMAYKLSYAAQQVSDPVWQLPLWPDYRRWLDSDIADINNNASSPMAGSVTAALFLEEFVPRGQRWIHIDSYAWHDANRPGRPKGGDIFGVRALFDAITNMANES